MVITMSKKDRYKITRVTLVTEWPNFPIVTKDLVVTKDEYDRLVGSFVSNSLFIETFVDARDKAALQAAKNKLNKWILDDCVKHLSERITE